MSLCFRLLLWHPDVCSKEVMYGMFHKPADLFVIHIVLTYFPTYFAPEALKMPHLQGVQSQGCCQCVQPARMAKMDMKSFSPSLSLSLSLSPHSWFCFLRCPCKPPPMKKASFDWLELGKVTAIVVSLAMSLVSAVYFGRKAFVYFRRRPETGTVTFI